MQNLPKLQHPIIFGVFASPWTTLKTEKRKFGFSWEMKSVSGHLNLKELQPKMKIAVKGHAWRQDVKNI